MEKFQIQGVPTAVYGEPSEKLFLFIHGRHGYKEEAAPFADIASQKGYQVLSFDLPEHGERKGETGTFNPWHAVSEFQRVLFKAKDRWDHISLRANSIGSYFSMLSFAEESLEQCLFVSPILDMEQLILNLMRWSDVTEDQLKKEKIIPTNCGETLSWEYLRYVRAHKVKKWDAPTSILYGTADNLTDRKTVDNFVQQHGCSLTVMSDGEHWFHTQEQLDMQKHWTTHVII